MEIFTKIASVQKKHHVNSDFADKVYKDMPKYQIPKSPGEFHIRTSNAGTPIVWNNKSSKGQVLIPCRDIEHANEVLEKLKGMKKGGEIWV